MGMRKTEEKHLLNFIKEYNHDESISITSINTYEIKQFDDDIGSIGEHLYVKCNVILNGRIDTKICYVNRKVFKRYVNKEESIIWE
jgi:hypothetical protein